VAVYLDSSALVKLIVHEPESGALRSYLGRHETRVSCALARVEVVRAVRPQGRRAIASARELLKRLHLVRLDEALLDTAADLDKAVVRSLDAIHLAAAQTLGGDLEALVTYDVRMKEAASQLGLVDVTAPSGRQ
jgi:uncharacterized protein